jgi:RNA polymerase sigma-70 factor, ECF subfamily
MKMPGVDQKLISEETLLAQARRFDLDGLSLIYDRYGPGLYAYALRLLGDPHQAEECVAETFNRFLQTIKTGGGPDHYLQAYLYRIAHNWITDQYRRSPPPPLDLEDQAVVETPGEAGIDEDCIAREQVRAAMHHLTEEQRQVVMLKYVEGWENDAIAQAMGKPVGAVKALQHRAIAALRRLLPGREIGQEGRYEQ